MANRVTLERWFDEGVEEGATHMVVKRDWFDGQCYPVFVNSGEEARKESKEDYTKNADRTQEVYNLHKPKAPQFAVSRVFDYDDVEA